MKKGALIGLAILAACLCAQACLAAEDLVTSAHDATGEQVPYILNYQSANPKFVIILFPGANGRVDPHWEGDKLVYALRRNFLLRSRKYIVDDDFVTVTTNASDSETRIQAILDDLKQRYPDAQIYLMGTSNGTYSTMSLAAYLSDKIAGEIHSSSLSRIQFLNAREYKNRHLVLHHKGDSCRVTPFSSAEYSHTKFGNDFIAMAGGISDGNPCEALAHHGYNGIEEETIQAVKKWIKREE